MDRAKKIELTIIATATLFAAIALIPAFGQWLLPRTPVSSPEAPTPTLHYTATALAQTVTTNTTVPPKVLQPTTSLPPTAVFSSPTTTPTATSILPTATRTPTPLPPTNTRPPFTSTQIPTTPPPSVNPTIATQQAQCQWLQNNFPQSPEGAKDPRLNNFPT